MPNSKYQIKEASSLFGGFPVGLKIAFVLLIAFLAFGDEILSLHTVFIAFLSCPVGKVDYPTRDEDARETDECDFVLVSFQKVLLSYIFICKKFEFKNREFF